MACSKGRAEDDDRYSFRNIRPAQDSGLKGRHQGIFGLSTSVSQLGRVLVDMQKNVDDLQENMGTVKQVKEQLSSLSPQGEGTSGSELLKKVAIC
jgi:hypothetical protein